MWNKFLEVTVLEVNVCAMGRVGAKQQTQCFVWVFFFLISSPCGPKTGVIPTLFSRQVNAGPEKSGNLKFTIQDSAMGQGENLQLLHGCVGLPRPSGTDLGPQSLLLMTQIPFKLCLSRIPRPGLFKTLGNLHPYPDLPT